VLALDEVAVSWEAKRREVDQRECLRLLPSRPRCRPRSGGPRGPAASAHESLVRHSMTTTTSVGVQGRKTRTRGGGHCHDLRGTVLPATQTPLVQRPPANATAEVVTWVTTRPARKDVGGVSEDAAAADTAGRSSALTCPRGLSGPSPTRGGYSVPPLAETGTRALVSLPAAWTADVSMANRAIAADGLPHVHGEGK